MQSNQFYVYDMDLYILLQLNEILLYIKICS